ncbi:beta-galactosidase [bacterium]|nr:MAG: beta-galactosidase [bacterium]
MMRRCLRGNQRVRHPFLHWYLRHRAPNFLFFQPTFMSRIFLVTSAVAVGAVLPMPSNAQGRVEFKRVFAPTDNIVAAPERPLRQSQCLNGRWQFQPVAVPRDFKRDTGTPPALPAPSATGWETTPIKIPSPWNMNTWGNGRDAGEGTQRPYVADSIYYPSYPESWEGVEMGWLRRSFSVPKEWGNKRVVLHFEAVAGEAQIIVNGKAIGSHFDSFLPFDLDVTSALKAGSNELLVGVRKSNLFNKVSPDYPNWLRRTYPNGSNMDNLVGIWNDVWLVGLPAVRADDAFMQSDVAGDTLRAQVTLRNDTATAQRVRVGGEVKAWVNGAGKDVLSAPEPKWSLGATALTLPSQAVTIPAGKSVTLQLQSKVGSKLKLWSPNNPNLYGAVFSVTDAKGQKVDAKYERFGWRQFSIVGKELRLNGQKIQLFGDLLHPFGPYIGSRRYAWAQLKAIKEMGGNMVRPHAQPHPTFYMDLADEMGLCVLDEGANFGSSVSQNLKEDITWSRMNSHTDDLVKRDRNHASVFGWSVANEMFAPLSGANPEERARETAKLVALARRPLALDPTRAWVSVDGDQDLDGALPVWNKHWGLGVPTIPDVNKPSMIGEHGGTYFAQPALMQDFGGDVVFESTAGRTVGLGVDAYQAIVKGAKPNLAVFSTSETAWFGLEHLPFGFTPAKRPPSKKDGIWFGAYVENQPGVQIERLPPYVMTFNPGFDASLPLYRPLPMFDAVRDAIAGKNAEKWAAKAHTQVPPHPVATNATDMVAFAGDTAGELFDSLSKRGVPMRIKPGDDATSQLLVIDGETLSAAKAPAAITRAQEILASGGRVWVMVRDKGAALPLLRPLLGAELRVAPRVATSLLHGASAQAVDGFALQDLYFADERPIQLAELEGPFVANAKVLLKAAKTDWGLYARQPESAKQSSLIIYEQLNRGTGVSLLQSTPATGGTLWVSSLDATGNEQRPFWTQLWRNLGVALLPPRGALVSLGRDFDVEWSYSFEKPADNWTAPDFVDGGWQTGKAPFGTGVPGGRPSTNWNSSDVWIRRDFEVKELPRTLRLTIRHDEDVEVYLNGVRVWSEPSFHDNYQEIELPREALAALKVGRNVIAAHCHQTEGGQFLDIGLSMDTLKAGNGPRPHDLLLDGPQG